MTDADPLSRTEILAAIEAAIGEYEGMTAKYDAARDVHTVCYERAELQIYIDTQDPDDTGLAWRIVDRDENGYPVREESSPLDSIAELRSLLDDL
jgi:hypothetical protein